MRATKVVRVREKMTIGEKMAAIRKAVGMTQDDLSAATGYSNSSIGNYENARGNIPAYAFIVFRNATDTHDIPLTDDEIAAFKKEQLDAWNYMVNFGDIAKATEMQPKLARCIELSYDLDLQVLYDIYCINYNCVIKEKKEALKLVGYLNELEPQFTDEHRYWHYRYLGAIEHWSWRYKAAVALYMKAEEIGNRYNLNDKALYYNIGSCFTYMGYPYRAIVYLEKIQIKKFDASNITFGLAIQRLLAINYAKLGRVDEALELLEGYHRYLIDEKKDDNFRLGRVYHHYGSVYQESGDYMKALENFNMASKYFDIKSEEHLENLCSKALLLRIINKNDDVVACLNEGLSIVTEGTLWSEWLHALKHSLTLDRKGSADYLEYTSIPRFHDYGKHALAIECYEWLSSNCIKNGTYKPAGEYSRKATEIYKQLIKGDLSL